MLEVAHWICEKWSEEAVDFARKELWLPKLEPVGSDELRRIIGGAEIIEEIPGNLLLNAGINLMETQLIGTTTTPYNITNCRLGVGNGVTAVAATDTDLSAATGAANRQWKLLNATYPTQAAQVLTFQSDFLTGEANFVWNEWGIDKGTANGTAAPTAPMLNRKIASLGTKATGTWTLTATLTLS